MKRHNEQEMRKLYAEWLQLGKSSDVCHRPPHCCHNFRLLDKEIPQTSPLGILSILLLPWCIWLGGSHAKLGFSEGVCRFAKEPPNAMALLQV